MTLFSRHQTTSKLHNRQICNCRAHDVPPTWLSGTNTMYECLLVYVVLGNRGHALDIKLSWIIALLLRSGAWKWERVSEEKVSVILESSAVKDNRRVGDLIRIYFMLGPQKTETISSCDRQNDQYASCTLVPPTR